MFINYLMATYKIKMYIIHAHFEELDAIMNLECIYLTIKYIQCLSILQPNRLYLCECKTKIQTYHDDECKLLKNTRTKRFCYAGVLLG